MKRLRLLSLLIMSALCFQSMAYERVYIADNIISYTTDKESFREFEDHDQYVTIAIHLPENSSHHPFLRFTLMELGSDNETAKLCERVGTNDELDKKVVLYLSNGEVLTSDNSVVSDARKESAKNSSMGIARVSIRFCDLISDKCDITFPNFPSLERYFAQKLRDYPIKKMVVYGTTYYFKDYNTANDIDGICAEAEKALGAKRLTYTSSAPSRTNNSSSSSSSSYGGSTSSYSSPKSTMYGSVRYITPAKSSSLSYLRECINKWEQCRTGGFTSARGIAVYSTNGYAYTSGMPTSFIDKIKEINKNEYKIEDVNVTAQGYVVVFGTYGYSVVSGPQAFIDKLHHYNAEKEHITSAVFNDSGHWAVVTDKNISWSDDYVGEFMKAAKTKFGFINSMFISANGAMIACCANGVYYKNVPSNVIDKIKSLSYIPKVVKFTDDGRYLITDGKSAYTYFL